MTDNRPSGAAGEGDDGADGTAEAPRRSGRPPDNVVARRRLVAALAAGSVLVVVLLVGIMVLQGEPESSTDYDDDVAERFLTVCTEDATDLGFAAPGEFCRCSYDRIAAEVPFERFVEIDAEMREDPGEVPDDVDRIRTNCFVGTATTGTTATTIEPAATVTTTAPAGG